MYVLFDKSEDEIAELAAGTPVGGQVGLKDIATVPFAGHSPANVMSPVRVALSGAGSSVLLSSQAMDKNNDQ